MAPAAKQIRIHHVLTHCQVLNEYQRSKYPDWPNLHHLEVSAGTRFDDLWQGVAPSANFLLIIFEQVDAVGVQAILDLWPNRAQVGVRRALANSALVPMLGSSHFDLIWRSSFDDIT